MYFIFNRDERDEPKCPGVRVTNGQFKPCCGQSNRELSTDILANVVSDLEISTEDTHCVITTVHGTFAKHASWMREDSKLCQALKKLPGTALRRFCWSGINSHTARLQAGYDLALYLREVKKQFPDNTRHFIIAHSHGGNVALYAMDSELNGSKLGDDVSGVVTLATPFINVQKRSLPKFVFLSVWLTMLFLALVSLVALFKPVALNLRSPTNQEEISGDVTWIFDLEGKGFDIEEAPDLHFEWRQFPPGDTGIWNFATPAGTSLLQNPARIDTPARNLKFIWNSEEVFTSNQDTMTTVQFRIYIDDKTTDWQIVEVVKEQKISRKPYNLSKSKSWNHIIFVTVMFLVWLALTVASTLFFRGRKVKLKQLFQILRERNFQDQPHTDKVLKPLKPKGLNPSKFLVIRPLGDEANMGLVVPQFLSWVQSRILGVLQAYYDWSFKIFVGGPLHIFTFLKLALAIIPVIFYTHFYGASVATQSMDTVLILTQDPLVGGVVVVILGLLFLSVPFGLLSLFFLLSLMLTSLPFGRDAMFLNHFASTTAEPAPVAACPVQIFHGEPEGGVVKPGLAHSQIYEEDVPIAQIVNWIKSRSTA